MPKLWNKCGCHLPQGFGAAQRGSGMGPAHPLQLEERQQWHQAVVVKVGMQLLSSLHHAYAKIIFTHKDKAWKMWHKEPQVWFFSLSSDNLY